MYYILLKSGLIVGYDDSTQHINYDESGKSNNFQARLFDNKLSVIANSVSIVINSSEIAAEWCEN